MANMRMRLTTILAAAFLLPQGVAQGQTVEEARKQMLAHTPPPPPTVATPIETPERLLETGQEMRSGGQVLTVIGGLANAVGLGMSAYGRSQPCDDRFAAIRAIFDFGLSCNSYTRAGFISVLASGPLLGAGIPLWISGARRIDRARRSLRVLLVPAPEGAFAAIEVTWGSQ